MPADTTPQRDDCCLQCGHTLRALTENRCPECGRHFDPDDPATYARPGVEGRHDVVYDVYRHPEQGYEPVKRGFSWPAFFFLYAWAFTKQLWLPGLVIFVLHEFAALAGARFEDAYATIMAPATFVICLVSGIYGNALRRWNLRRRGYQHLYTIDANSPEHAVERVAGSLPGSIPASLPDPAVRVIWALIMVAILFSLWESVVAWA